jgi:hypothetical protein
MPTAADQIPNGISWIRRKLDDHTRELRELRGRMASLPGIGNSLADKLPLAGGTLTGNLNVGDRITLDTDGVITADGLILGPDATTFSIGAVLPGTATDMVVWRAPKNVQVIAVRGYRVGSSGASINATNDGLDILATDLSLSTATTWLSGPSVQNEVLETGATLVLSVRAVTGSPSAVTIQVDVQEVP